MNEGTLQGEARFRRRAIKVDEAMRLVMEALELGRQESVPLWEAAGRRLAEAVSATTDWPPFARSGMDGFAVRSADTALASPGAPATLRIAATVAAGALASADVAPGTAVRIMTGGAVPPGADAVVMLEQTTDAVVDGQPAVLVKRTAEPGQNIAPRGEEFRCGSVFAGPGELLRPGHAALLGTFGYAHVPVYARPRVAVLATGAELLPVEAPLAPGRIRDSNSAMVAALVAQHGGVPVLLGRVPDEPGAAAQAIVDALQQCDLIITTGGVSVGDYDVMASLLSFLATDHPAGKEASAASFASAAQTAAKPGLLPQDSRLLFNKAAMRPGAPTSAAVLSGKLLLALSGNPGACFVGFELFAKPALQRLQGATPEQAMPKQVTAQLAGSFTKGSPHERFVRARLYTENAVLCAAPLGFGKSSMMASIPEADGLIRIKAGSEGAVEGDIVDVIVL
ncbi:molybdopterin molybdotransferase MoeA [Paenibacillus sacheonensis]|uniref:Molybdopterin molybdenumtransferase n=1 Tax=Paenibacillus sacheonensis TaxID=742054 RepID=A0A7X4YUU9_9BACL|nr:gephyrin-like molybdotransferase Glp [Paenibacillus sacheonensis]MBM7569121.1 molybdopterin molybdotransferase [Paenibacillus sacheonensis]NBC72955.1 molybdopterin molybdenumtransferase MoeA [Paenibacillus sacheonensis]